jgi:hypothetical protein
MVYSQELPTIVLPRESLRLNEVGAPVLLRKALLFWVLLAVLSKLVPPIGPVFYVCAAVWALRGARQTIEAFTVMMLLLIGNAAVVSGTGGELFRWFVLFAGFGRVMWDSFFSGKESMPSGLAATTGVFFCFALLGAMAGAMPGLAVFKLISLTAGVVAIFGSFYRTRHLHAYWSSWF